MKKLCMQKVHGDVKGMKHLGKYCPDLQTLTLVSCADVTDGSALRFAKYGPPGFAELRLRGHAEVTSLSLIAMCLSFPYIRLLDVVDCVGITDEVSVRRISTATEVRETGH